MKLLSIRGKRVAKKPVNLTLVGTALSVVFSLAITSCTVAAWEKSTGEHWSDKLIWNQNKVTIEQPVLVQIEEPEHVMTDAETLAVGIYTVIRGHNVTDTAAIMVGEVILNRVNSTMFPSTICDVLMQPYQFGELDKGFSWEKIAKTSNKDSVLAYEAAQTVITGSDLLPDDVLYVSETTQGTETVALLNGLYFCR